MCGWLTLRPYFIINMHAELKWIKHSLYKREIGGFKSPDVYHKDINSKETVSKTADESLRWFESMPLPPNMGE